jgi:hypothetical protein
LTNRLIYSILGRKKRVAGEVIPFDETWFPKEWVAFLQFGPLSPKPHKNWIVFRSLSQGPAADGSVVVPTPGGRSQQRKNKRNEKRQLEGIGTLLGMVDMTSEDGGCTSAAGSAVKRCKESPLTEASSIAEFYEKGDREELAAVIDLTEQVSKIHDLSQKDHDLQAIKLEMELVNSLDMPREDKQQLLKELYEKLKSLKK